MIVSIPTLSMSAMLRKRREQERGSACVRVCVRACVSVCGEKDGEIGHTKEILSTFLHIFILPEKTRERE